MPGEFKQLALEIESSFGVAPDSVLGPELVVARAAIGQCSVLKSRLFGCAVTASLSAAAVCEGTPGLAEHIVHAMSSPLWDEQENRIDALANWPVPVETAIQQTVDERDSFFGENSVRDPEIERSFELRIRALRNAQKWQLVCENIPAGALWQCAAASSGLFAIYSDRSLSRLLAAKAAGGRDFHLLMRAAQGRSPDPQALKIPADRLPVRPVVGCFFSCGQRTAARLITSVEPAVRDFTSHVLFCSWKAANSSQQITGRLRVPPAWYSRISALLEMRNSEKSRLLTLSKKAEELLDQYAQEMGRAMLEKGESVRCAVVQATAIGIILHEWNRPSATQISDDTMARALAANRFLIDQSQTTARLIIAGNEERALLAKAASLWDTLQSFGGPVVERELYRSCANNRKSAHSAELDLLLKNGYARRLEDGRLQIVSRPPGARP